MGFNVFVHGVGKEGKRKWGGEVGLVAWSVWFFLFSGASMRMGACTSQGSETLLVYCISLSRGLVLRLVGVAVGAVIRVLCGNGAVVGIVR